MAAEQLSIGQTAAAGGAGAGVDWLPYLFALLFLAKALILAFWITPLWQTPDEKQHFHYAQDIAMGKGLPVIGRAPVDIDFVTGYKKPPPPRAQDNHIAQHPPVYYVLAAAAWRAATVFADSPDTWFRAPRAISALAGAAALLTIYHLMLSLTGRPVVSLGVMASVSFIPMFSYMSSGTSNDTTTMLFACLAALYWSRYLLRPATADAYRCAAWLALACVTKMTVLVLAAPMLAILFFESDFLSRRRWLHVAGVLATAASLPSLWLARNWLLYGNPLMTAAEQAGFFAREQAPLQVSFARYLSTEPAVEGYFNHFFGLFGSLTPSWILQLHGLPYSLISVIALAGALLALAHLLGRVFGRAADDCPVLSPAWMRPTLAVALVVVAVLAFLLIHAPAPWSPRRVLYAALAVAFALAPTAFLVRLERPDRLALYALMVFGFFAAVLLWKVYGFYVLDGRLRAIHGRYLFPLIPFMLAGLVVPALAALRWRVWPIVLVAMVLGATELHVFLDQVMPFYKGIR